MRKESESFEVLSRPNMVNVAYMVGRCRVLGPGDRFVIWVQGCPLRCPGCHNPQFQPFVDRMWMSIGQLARRIFAVPGLEGVTYAGGEPFAQAEALARLSQTLRSEELTVLTYTGFTLEELRSGAVSHAEELLAETDLLLDGRYREELPTARPWRGSDNQHLIALSDRYANQVETWNRPLGQSFELRIRADGTLEALGVFPALLFRKDEKDVPAGLKSAERDPTTNALRGASITRKSNGGTRTVLSRRRGSLPSSKSERTVECSRQQRTFGQE